MTVRRQISGLLEAYVDYPLQRLILRLRNGRRSWYGPLWLRDEDDDDPSDEDWDDPYPESWDNLISRAEEQYDGHVTIMRFTTGWKIVFGTPELTISDRVFLSRIQGHMTFDEAADAAFASTVGDRVAFAWRNADRDATLDDLVRGPNDVIRARTHDGSAHWAEQPRE